MRKKYKTVPEGGMLRIIALKDFSDVKKGDRGGLIEKEANLSHIGDCWVYDEAKVYEDAAVSGNAKVFDNTEIHGSAYVCGYAQVSDNAKVYGRALIYESAKVSENAEVYGYARIFGEAYIYGKAMVCGYCWIKGKARIYGDAKLWTWIIGSCISASIKNNKDYVMFGDRKKFFIEKVEDITEIDYIKNIQTIRQLYVEEV